jgi:hypothetical protein
MLYKHNYFNDITEKLEKIVDPHERILKAVKINEKMLNYQKKIVLRMSQCAQKNGRHCSGKLILIDLLIQLKQVFLNPCLVQSFFLVKRSKKKNFNLRILQLIKGCRGSAFSANHTTSFSINNDIKWQFNKDKLK